MHAHAISSIAATCTVLRRQWAVELDVRDMYALLNAPAPTTCPDTQCWDCFHIRVQDDRGRLHGSSPMIH